MLKTTLTLSTLLLFTACGGGSNNNEKNNTSTPITQSFKNKELYSFNLNFLDQRQRYDMKQIDALNSNISYQYFNFDAKTYEVDTTDKQIFVNGKRGAFQDIDYALQTDGSIIASLEDKAIFKLALIEVKEVKTEVLEEYGSKINIEGKRYLTKLSYLANFYTIKDLISNDSFENLEAFVEVYKKEPFRGSVLNGLQFGEESNLTQVFENNSSHAGSYEIRLIDEKEILLLNPNNTKRYGNNECFVLDFSKVWTAKCHLKSSVETLNFYNKEVYDDVLKYMQNAFVNVDISI